MKLFSYLVILLVTLFSSANVLGQEPPNKTAQEAEKILREKVLEKIVLSSCADSGQPGRFYLKQDQTLPNRDPTYVYYEGSKIGFRIVPKVITVSDRGKGVQWSGCAFVSIKGPVREFKTGTAKAWSDYRDMNIELSFYIDKINNDWHVASISRSFAFIELKCNEIPKTQQ